MTIRSRLHEDEARASKVAKSPLLLPKSPVLAGKRSIHELMFEMDDEELPKGALAVSAKDRDQRGSSILASSPPSSLPREGSTAEPKGKGRATLSVPLVGSLDELASLHISTMDIPPLDEKSLFTTPGRKASGPWGETLIPSEKLEMKQILAQTDSRTSNIATALREEMNASQSPKLQPVAKMSQKERKKQMAEQQKVRRPVTPPPAIPPPPPPPPPTSSSDASGSRPSPWQMLSSGTKLSLKDVLSQPSNASPKPASEKRRPSPAPALTMRQTVPGNADSRRTAETSKPPPSPIEQRKISRPNVTSRHYSSPAGSATVTPQRGVPQSPDSPIVPKSVRHLPTVEPMLQLSLADILTQQQLEKDVIKEAVAKRSLQEIQEEQAFQEWWDQEEAATKARLQREEVAAKGNHTPGKSGKSGRGGVGRGRGRGGGRGGGRGVGQSRGRDGGGRQVGTAAGVGTSAGASPSAIGKYWS